MSNRRRHDLELKPDQLVGLDQSTSDAINERLRRIAEHQEASSGLRGTVYIAKQKKFGKTKGRETILDPGMILEDNRIAILADPIDDQDAVNLRTVRKMISDADPDAGDDITDLIDDEDDPEVSGADGFVLSGGLNDSITGTANMTLNVGHLRAFQVESAFTFSKISFKRGSAAGGVYTINVGIYDSDRVLVTSVLVPTLGNTNVYTTSIGQAITIPPGMYYYGWTSSSTTTPNVCGITVAAALNSCFEFCGTDANATTGGVLNSPVPVLTLTTMASYPWVFLHS